MPAVINVGGPVAWGLVVLVSAWAVRAGRALAGSRRARRKQDDEEVDVDPSAPQPRFLQRLSATAIRMLVETGALPCAVLELSDGGGGSDNTGGKAKRPGATPRAAKPGAATGPVRGTGTADGGAGAGGGGAVLYGPPRIVPPELAAAVPCMSAAAWVRALESPEHWRAELTRAAAAITAAAAPATGGAPIGIAAGSGGAALRASYSSPYPGAYGGARDGPSAGGGGPGPQGFSLSSPCPLPAATSNAHAPQTSALGGQAGTTSASDRGGGGGEALGSSLRVGGASPLFAPQHSSPLPLQLDTAAAAAGPFGGVGGRGSLGGGATGAAAAAANMAALPYPPRHALLVVLGRSERVVAAVTAAAAKAGYSRAATWVGSAAAFAATSLAGPRLPCVSRNGLWLALQLGPDPLFHVPSLVLDVRRPDERLSYGAIRGTVNVPAEELAAALALPPLEWRRRFGVPRPGPDDVVITCSRSNRRAAWAAQLCLNAGLNRVFVYDEGVYGWRLEDRVKPYRAYDLGALPPDPEPFTPEEPDEAAGLEELHSLGMPLRQGPPPSRFALVAPAPAPTPSSPGPHAPAAATAPAPVSPPPALAPAGGGSQAPLAQMAAGQVPATAAGFGAGAGGLWQRAS